MLDDNKTYDSSFLIDRIYSNDALIKSNTKVKIPEPSLQYCNQKTCILNFNTICNAINRDKEIVKKFFERELLVNSSLDVNGNLLMSGRYDNVSKIKQIFNNYLKKYVICKECKSLDTVFEKVNKLLFIKCQKCMSSSAIKNI